MSDAVAIVSVASSGIVGLGGIFSGIYGATKARRWQAGQERAADLRAVLDNAATNLHASFDEIGKAHLYVSPLAGPTGASADEAKGLATAALNRSVVARDELWALENQIKLRQGSASELAVALNTTRDLIGKLSAIVQFEVSGGHDTLGVLAELMPERMPPELDYTASWRKARDAEAAFYDICVGELGSGNGRSGNAVSRPGTAELHSSPVSPPGTRSQVVDD